MTTQTKDKDLHFMQDFEVITIWRSQIKLSEYNPRIIGDKEYKDLKKSMKKMLLKEPLIWNKKTGHLVGGHQRIRILDEEWNKKHEGEDYKLTVAKVDIDLKEEIELNIALNNPRIMGRYSFDKMHDLLTSDFYPEIDYDVACIKDEDLISFGIASDLTNLENESVADIINNFEEIKQKEKSSISEEVQKQNTDQVKKIKKDTKANELDTYVTISFTNQDDKRSFMRRIGEDQKSVFIKGEIFVKKYFSE